MVTHNAEDDEKAQKAFLFLCLIGKDWGTFFNHTRTCEHTHTAQKHISPFTVRSQASTCPSIEKHCSAHTYFDYRCSLSSTFCPTLSLPLPIYIWVERGTKREKSAKKWSFPCNHYWFWQLYLTEQTENIFYLRKGCGILHPNSLLEPTVPFMAKTAQKGIERLGEFHVNEALL